MLMAGQREKKTQSHGRPGWLPGNVSLSESQHEIGSYALCLVTVKPQGEIIPFWGIFFLITAGTCLGLWKHMVSCESHDWKIKTSPFATDLGFDSELGTGKYFRKPCIS